MRGETIKVYLVMEFYNYQNNQCESGYTVHCETLFKDEALAVYERERKIIEEDFTKDIDYDDLDSVGEEECISKGILKKFDILKEYDSCTLTVNEYEINKDPIQEIYNSWRSEIEDIQEDAKNSNDPFPVTASYDCGLDYVREDFSDDVGREVGYEEMLELERAYDSEHEV